MTDLDPQQTADALQAAICNDLNANNPDDPCSAVVITDYVILLRGLDTDGDTFRSFAFSDSDATTLAGLLTLTGAQAMSALGG